MNTAFFPTHRTYATFQKLCPFIQKDDSPFVWFNEKRLIFCTIVKILHF